MGQPETCETYPAVVEYRLRVLWRSKGVGSPVFEEPAVTPQSRGLPTSEHLQTRLRGQVDPQDPKNNRAAKLLERISMKRNRVARPETGK